MERANSWNSGKIFEARARANTMDLCKRSLMLKNSPPQDNFTERYYGVVSLKKHAQKNPRKHEDSISYIFLLGLQQITYKLSWYLVH